MNRPKNIDYSAGKTIVLPNNKTVKLVVEVDDQDFNYYTAISGKTYITENSQIQLKKALNQAFGKQNASILSRELWDMLISIV